MMIVHNILFQTSFISPQMLLMRLQVKVIGKKTLLHRNQLAPSSVLHLLNCRQSKELIIITAIIIICSFQEMRMTWIPQTEKHTERESKQEWRYSALLKSKTLFFPHIWDLNNKLDREDIHLQHKSVCCSAHSHWNSGYELKLTEIRFMLEICI